MDIKLLFIVALAVHGIGHVIGLMTFLDLWEMSVRSSILDSMGLDQGLIKVLSFIWIIPFIAFIASAWGARARTLVKIDVNSQERSLVSPPLFVC